jgi:hypothetical protein
VYGRVVAAVALVMGLLGDGRLAAATGEPVSGYDVSYLDCDTPLPEAFSFGVVNVNHGRPYTANPCFASQVTWALNGSSQTQPVLSFYLNTANPGPEHSAYWPVRGTPYPRACDGSSSADCAYDFGWLFAQHAFTRAADVVGPTTAYTSQWWLDVETANRWSDDQAANVATLLGTIDALHNQGVRQVGIYATRSHWAEITGARSAESPVNAPFAALPNWIPRLGLRDAAEDRCSPSESLTGGPVQLVQYEFFLDKDIACPLAY